MKLDMDTRVATGEGFDSVADFKIALNPKAFTVLSDTIYKDKIGSIIRELSCNAFDAHIENDNGDVPFDIHLPDAFEPYFSIRDYGKGISPDDIKTVYTTYFESTKDDSNDVVGAFGLGSKTPFSYTDAFTVISIYDGIKTMYNAHKSRGLPSIVAYGKSEPTDEPDGLEVRVSVEAMDYKSFASAAKRQLKLFPVKPNILNGKIEWETYTPILEVNGFTYYSIDGVSGYRYGAETNVLAGLFIKQGPVSYPVDFDAMNQVLNSKSQKRGQFYEYLRRTVSYHYNKGIIIDMPIGTVEVTASREGISYKDVTVRNIMARLDQIAVVITKEVVVKLDKSYDEGEISFVKALNSLDSYFKHALKADDMNKRYPKFEFFDQASGVIARLKTDAKIMEGVEVRKYDLVSYAQARATQSFHMRASDIDSNDTSKGKKKYINLEVDMLAGGEDNDGNENVIYIKDINNGFVNRLSEHNKSPMAILMDVPDGITKGDIANVLGDEFMVRNVSELPKVKASSNRKGGNGGHSITGGRQRLWFDVQLSRFFKIFNGNQTCYAAGCEQVFGESFDEAAEDKYAFFTTFNNKIDSNKLDITDRLLCERFCKWLQCTGYNIVAIAAPMRKAAKKSGKFFCINELWKAHEDDFIKGMWDMFLNMMVSNYYVRVVQAYSNTGWRHDQSFEYYDECFDLLGMNDHHSLKSKYEKMCALQANTSHMMVDDIMERAILDNANDDRKALFQKLNDSLGVQSYRLRNIGKTLEQVEADLLSAGVTLEVVGSEIVDGYIKLIKDNIDQLILASTVSDEKIDSYSITTGGLTEPFYHDTYRLTEDELRKIIKKKAGISS